MQNNTESNPFTAKVKAISDETRNHIGEVFFVICFGDSIDNLIGTCSVKIKENAVAEIYKININEPYRGKHYGSMLWKFAETYLIQKHYVKRFIGELNIGTNPTINVFWEKQGFCIRYEDSDCAFAVKEVSDDKLPEPWH